MHQPGSPPGLMTREETGVKCLTRYKLQAGNSHPYSNLGPGDPAQREPPTKGKRLPFSVRQGARPGWHRRSM